MTLYTVDTTGGNYKIEALDVLGRPIETKNVILTSGSGLFSLDVSSWQQGTYFIRLYNDKGMVYGNYLLISR